MTLQKFGLTGISSTVSALILSTGILALVAMMVLPLPTFLLDTFFVSNILLSILVLMVALHAYRPLDFSSFPSLLLIATVLRLGLNVASTRIILGKGQEGPEAAGQVINAFGQFVIAGNYAVGIFVFVNNPYFVCCNLTDNLTSKPSNDFRTCASPPSRIS